MNDKKITWMHVEKAKTIPEEIADTRQCQGVKWSYLAFFAPDWKFEEYRAQALAWKELESEPHLNWCNPLARA